MGRKSVVGRGVGAGVVTRAVRVRAAGIGGVALTGTDSVTEIQRPDTNGPASDVSQSFGLAAAA